MNAWREARNILAVRLDNTGDVVMLGPALRAVKQASPDARISLLASPAGSAAAPLLPWIDDVIVWRSIWQDVGGRMPFDPQREWELIQLLAERRFDAALIFTSFSQTPQVPGYVCYLAGIPLRAGESKEFGGSVLTTELRGAPDDLHQAERNLRLIEQLGFPVRDRRLAVAISDEDREAARVLLADVDIDAQRPFTLIHPGASAEARRYPPERMGEVAHLLRRQGHQVLITGVDKEAPIVDEARSRAPGVRCLVGQTTLAQYAALVARAALVICGNTLPLHLADAVGTPLVVLYSGTDYEEQWRPREVAAELLRRPTACHPCYRFTCPIDLPCLDISPCDVVEAAERLLGQSRSVETLMQQAAGGDA
jgi:ADP-heptose:LPS heptosyltransferase